jgi:cell division protein FtsB
MVEKLQHERFLRRKDIVSESMWILLRRVFIGVLIIALVWLGSATWRTYQKQLESGAMRSVAETEFEDLRAREERLKAQIADLKTIRGKEAVLRERYGLAKEGEKMVVIVEPEGQSVATTSPTWKSWVKGILR